MRLSLDPDDSSKGFKLRFEFAPNPYFEEAVLSKEYHTKERSHWTGEIGLTEIVASSITWKAGKDVTVEVVKKKAKGGGAKKEKQKAKGGKEEPRNSFFRVFFKSLKEDGPVPDDIDLEAMGLGDDDEDYEQVMEMIMGNDHDMGCAVRDNIIPYAVRWYTGEAAPDMDDGDEGEEEESDEGDTSEADEVDDDEDEDEAPKKGGRKGPKGGAGPKRQGGGAGGAGGAAAAGGEAGKEDCKQQ
ncbi:unnamed protein product [Prorocentrum cordatum]|uniref:Nucleosome assembly protein n=1 Tax=Prorocentrum cordatum TaxID=2364126 RepID=A0ABN9U9H1_9DINO|nr:unnamed protein product [Polarella glacialis]